MAAQSLSVDIIESALWPQGDIRDPLGVWGARLVVTGTGTGGIKVGFNTRASVAALYVYTVYSINSSQLSGTLSGNGVVKARILTGWPNIEPTAGIVAYGSLHLADWQQSSNFTSPISGVRHFPLLTPNDRFLLSFDPRQGVGARTVVEVELGENVVAAVYGFEVYGYFWDRSVMQAPGGPRHPGQG